MAAPGCCACSAAVESSARTAARKNSPCRHPILVTGPLQTSKQELQRHLHDTRIVVTSTSYITETTLASVVDHALLRTIKRKLRMVEDVECLCPELQFGALCDGGGLQQRHIVVVEARTGEESPHCVSYLSDRFRNKVIGIEIGQPLSRVLIFIKMAAVVRVAGHIYVCIEGAKQRIIVILA